MAGRTSAPVLILGETGVGKEIVAHLIHAASTRRQRPFIAVNCSGIPETLLESELFGHVRGSFTGAFRDKAGLVTRANNGTLFLDELGEMSLRMQASLLRFAESGEMQRVGADAPAIRVNVRLIGATHRDLKAQIASGAFREDLYYRLNTIQIYIPPLRERGDDILLLLDHYTHTAARDHGLTPPTFTPEAREYLMAYPWPGNVRELRNLAESLVVRTLAGHLTPAHLPPMIRAAIANPRGPRRNAPAGEPAPAAVTSGRVQELWDRMAAGEDFWIVVRQAFKARQITRVELAALIDRGLRETRGSYRALLKIFHLQPEEYKRFHGFLRQQQCTPPLAPHRIGGLVARKKVQPTSDQKASLIAQRGPC
jgi:DNA-binding NtrC family response regulator